MKMFVIFLLLFSFSPLEAFACSPCQTTWPMERMVSESEIMIMGQRVDRAHKNSYKEKDAAVEIRIDELLKPHPELKVGDVLEVNSWYGSCPYGLQMKRFEKAVIFLNKASDGTWFTSPTYESATYKHALCNDEAMTLDKKSLLVWDPVIRKNVKYPLAEFRRVFLNRYNAQTLAPAQQ